MKLHSVFERDIPSSFPRTVGLQHKIALVVCPTLCILRDVLNAIGLVFWGDRSRIFFLIRCFLDLEYGGMFDRGC